MKSIQQGLKILEALLYLIMAFFPHMKNNKRIKKQCIIC
jgi:hypothetical protein